MFTIAISGSRNHEIEPVRLAKGVDAVAAAVGMSLYEPNCIKYTNTRIIQGWCNTGVDKSVRDFCAIRHIKTNAEDEYNPRLGEYANIHYARACHARNYDMAIDCDVGLAFWTGKTKGNGAGTYSFIQKCISLGKPCLVYRV